MSTTRTLAVASLCFSLSTALFGDTRLSIEHTEAGKPAQIQTVMVTAGKVRMEQGSLDETLLLYHQANNTFYAIEPSEKSYMVLDPETAGTMMDQAAQMRQQMMAELEERLAELPEEQRQQMMAMMELSGQPLPGHPQEPVRYEASGQSDDVGGFACRWVAAYEGQTKVRELCLTDPGAMGMPSADRDTIMAMQSAMQAMAERLGNAGMFQDEMPDGFPVHVRHFGPGGDVSSEQQVREVSRDALDGSLFEVPAGYERRELPTLPQR